MRSRYLLMKTGGGTCVETVAFVLQLRPLAGRILLNRREGRRTSSSLGPLFLGGEFHRHVEAVLDRADASS